MKPVYAALITILLIAGAYWLVTRCTDGILMARPSLNKNPKAAIAIRDPAPAYQQWGTAHFTQPYLEKYYNEWRYFNQEEGDHQKEDFLLALKNLLQRYKQVDLYLLAHSNNYYTWVKQIPPSLRKNLRLVYNSGCRDDEQAKTWLQMGAKTYIGHPGYSASPLFYFFFLRRWTRNADIASAVKASNNGMQKLLRIGKLFSQSLDPNQVYQQSEGMIHGNQKLKF
jgi:hypothetical protein